MITIVYKTVYYIVTPDDDFAIKLKYVFNPYPGFQDANLWIMFYSILFNRLAAT